MTQAGTGNPKPQPHGAQYANVANAANWIALFAAIGLSLAVYSQLHSIAIFSDSSYYMELAWDRLENRTDRTTWTAQGWPMLLAAVLSVGGVGTAVLLPPLLWCLTLIILFFTTRRLFPNTRTTAGFAVLFAVAVCLRPLPRDGMDAPNFLLYLYRTTPMLFFIVLGLASLTLKGRWRKGAGFLVSILLATSIREPAAVLFILPALWIRLNPKSIKLGILGILAVLLTGNLVWNSSLMPQQGVHYLRAFSTERWLSNIQTIAQLALEQSLWIGAVLIAIGIAFALRRLRRPVLALLLAAVLLFLIQSMARPHLRYALPPLVLLAPFAGFALHHLLLHPRLRSGGLLLAPIALAVFGLINRNQYEPIGSSVTPQQAKRVRETLAPLPETVFLHKGYTDLCATISMHNAGHVIDAGTLRPLKHPPAPHQTATYIEIPPSGTTEESTARRILMQDFDLVPRAPLHWQNANFVAFEVIPPTNHTLRLGAAGSAVAGILWLNLRGATGSTEMFFENKTNNERLDLPTLRGGGWQAVRYNLPSHWNSNHLMLDLRSDAPLSLHTTHKSYKRGDLTWFPITGQCDLSTLELFPARSRRLDTKYGVRLTGMTDLRLPPIKGIHQSESIGIDWLVSFAHTPPQNRPTFSLTRADGTPITFKEERADFDIRHHPVTARLTCFLSPSKALENGFQMKLGALDADGNAHPDPMIVHQIRIALQKL